MRTINISLPKTMADNVEEAVKSGAYASKSEFFRMLLRGYLTTQVSDVNLDEEIQMDSFQANPLSEVEDSLRASGKYNEKFIKSVVGGLKKSSQYK